MKRLFLLAALIATGCGQIRLGGTIPTSSPALVQITLLSMPDAVEDIPYTTQTVTVTGGTSPYTCAVTSGSLPTGITETSECVYGGTPTTPATYNFTVTATDAVMATAQQAYTIIISASSSLPADWSSTDIGTGMLPGSCAFAAGVWTVVGSGISFFTVDQQHMCYQTVSGLKQIIANVTACPGSNPRCNVGMRSSLAAGAANLMCGTGFGAEFAPNSSWRINDNDATGGEGVGSGSHPWKLLTVNGNVVSCFYGDSSVGPWTQESSQVITFSTSSYILGLAVWGDTASDSTTATFASVAISTFSPPVSADFGGYRPVWQGYGSTTVGGRGGTIIHVTNLNDSGAGSFRTAVTTAGARIIVFDTSGVIPLASEINVTNPYMTIAGQSAPSPGIIIQNYAINYNTHDIVEQHIRHRIGTNGISTCSPAIRFGIPPSGTAAFNIALDHVSVAWGNSTTVSHVQNGQDIAIYDTLWTTGLENFGGCGTNAPYGPNNIWYASPNGTGTLMRSLFSNVGQRDPLVGVGFKFIHINNVVYNNMRAAGVDYPSNGAVQLMGWPYPGYPGPLDFVSIGNVFIAGPATTAGAKPYQIAAQSATSPAQLPFHVYLSDNSGMNMTIGDQWGTGVTFCTQCTPGQTANEGNTRVNTPPSWFPPFNITAISNTGTVVRDYVLLHVGAWPHARDTLDTTIVANVTAGTGLTGAITSQTQQGGYPTLTVNTSTFVPVSTPNNPGTCGTTSASVVRTRIECQLETLAQGIE